MITKLIVGVYIGVGSRYLNGWSANPKAMRSILIRAMQTYVFNLIITAIADGCHSLSQKESKSPFNNTRTIDIQDVSKSSISSVMDQ